MSSIRIYGKVATFPRFIPFAYPGLRYDCERNEWNHCEEFNFTDHAGPLQSDDEDDEDEYRWGEPVHSQRVENPPHRVEPNDQMVDYPPSEQAQTNLPHDQHSPPEYHALLDEEDEEDDDEEYCLKYVWGDGARPRWVEKPVEHSPHRIEPHGRVVGHPPLEQTQVETADQILGEPLPEQTQVETADQIHGEPLSEQTQVETADQILGEPFPEQVQVDLPHHEHFSHVKADDMVLDEPLPEQVQVASPHDEHPPSHVEASDQVPDGDDMDGTADLRPPPFNSDAHLHQMKSVQYQDDSGASNRWEDGGDFLYKRYGLVETSGETSTKKRDLWTRTLGLKRMVPSCNLVTFHDSILCGAWPDIICDLSAGLTKAASLPPRSPDAAIDISLTSSNYLITLGRDVDWKLLIKDPLTILQIKREGWDCDSHALVLNLVEKGIPFQVLNCRVIKDPDFYDHKGPVIHPTGKSPTLIDYLAYRHELAEFFRHCPHAYAAALSAGGIMWRLAVDVLPFPHEDDLTRPFNGMGCTSVTVNGIRYWSPKLTIREEDFIAGLFKWSTCKLEHVIRSFKDASLMNFSF